MPWQAPVRDTRTDEIEHGSWFYGRIYEKRCDLSPDGEWLVYFASAQHASDFPTWTGLCRPPWLKTVAESEGVGTWLGGGFWRDERTLLVARPGGRIGLANWTLEGFIGQLFKTIGHYVPPASGLKSPAQWGTETCLVELFGRRGAKIGSELRPCPSHPRVLGKQGASFVDRIENAIRCIWIVDGNMKPDVVQVLLG